MGICVKELGYAMIILLGSITFGTIMCYPSPAGNEIRRRHNLSNDSTEWSFYNSVSSLFAISGPFVTIGFLKLFKNSRRKVVYTLSIIGTAFWLLNCLTKYNIWVGIVMRAFLGVVMGSYSSISPMYLVEISPTGRSGFFGSLNQIGIVIGMVFFDFIGPSLSYVSMNFVGAGITGLQSCLIWLIEESPVVESINEEEEKENEIKQKEEEERKIEQQKEEEEKEKKKHHHKHHKKHSFFWSPSKQEKQIKHKSKDERMREITTPHISKRVKETLWQKKYMLGLFSGILMMLLQQFCGINAILTNLADLMDKSGLKMNGNYQGGIASCSQLIAVFIGACIIDRIGRRTTWIISCSMIAVFMLIFALNDKFNWSNVLPLICIFLYQLGFGLGMGPIPWFIIPEYFIDDVRPQATMIVVASNWIFAFVVIFIWPIMNRGMGMFGSLLFFMFVSVAAIIFGIFCVHEPKFVMRQDQVDEYKFDDEDDDVKVSEDDIPENL